ncbi:hypothetical protein [Halomarina oriensis]|uniref:Uncharacterized protein n=1 Tax=Halomarina oriensis TaxID=671145 RepID=A0A6B0GK50_9EURY|nr:hypothetical protein [Halomarina oriensis]MWG33779.1 hypothetical protein [Halomarina oriensis]
MSGHETAEPDEAPGAVTILPASESFDERVFAIEGKPAAEDEELATTIVTDLRTVIERASGPERRVTRALASHDGTRAHLDIQGSFPGRGHGYEADTRFSEVFLAATDPTVFERSVELDIPDTE